MNWKLQAEKLLKERLQKTANNPTQPQVDLAYVTGGEYLLFLDELRQQGKYLQPDHWKNLELPADFSKPVTGVRSIDALAFCGWLTAKASNKIGYRLPTFEEAKKFRDEEGEIASWCSAGDKYVLVGLTDEKLDSLKQQISNLGHLGKNWTTDWLIQDQNEQILNKFGFNNDYTTWDYRSIKIPYLRRALQTALEISNKYPKRDLVVATNYDLAYAQQVAAALKISHNRNIETTFNNFSLIEPALLPGSKYPEISSAVKNKNYELAEKLVEKIVATDVIEERWLYLLKNCLAMLNAKNIIEQRKAFRLFTLHIAFYAYVGYVKLAEEYILKKTREIFRGEKTDASFLQNLQKAQQFFSELGVHIQILLVQEENQLPAWEGVRLVRHCTD